MKSGNYINVKGKKVNIKKEKYDFFYDPNLNFEDPLVTICYLWLESGDVGRGVAVYNPKDEQNKEAGKAWAKKFAVAKLRGKDKITMPNGNGENDVDLGEISRREAIQTLIRTRCPFTKKAEKNPELSWWERRFLFGGRKMEQYKIGRGTTAKYMGKTLSHALDYASYHPSFNPIGFATKDIKAGDVITTAELKDTGELRI